MQKLFLKNWTVLGHSFKVAVQFYLYTARESHPKVLQTAKWYSARDCWKPPTITLWVSTMKVRRLSLFPQEELSGDRLRKDKLFGTAVTFFSVWYFVDNHLLFIWQLFVFWLYTSQVVSCSSFLEWLFFLPLLIQGFMLDKKVTCFCSASGCGKGIKEC